MFTLFVSISDVLQLLQKDIQRQADGAGGLNDSKHDKSWYDMMMEEEEQITKTTEREARAKALSVSTLYIAFPLSRTYKPPKGCPLGGPSWISIRVVNSPSALMYSTWDFNVLAFGFSLLANLAFLDARNHKRPKTLPLALPGTAIPTSHRPICRTDKSRSTFWVSKG